MRIVCRACDRLCLFLSSRAGVGMDGVAFGVVAKEDHCPRALPSSLPSWAWRVKNGWSSSRVEGKENGTKILFMTLLDGGDGPYS